MLHCCAEPAAVLPDGQDLALRQPNLVMLCVAFMCSCLAPTTLFLPYVHLSLQRVYRAYAARLVARLPKPSSGNLAASAVLGTSDWHVRLSDDDIGVRAGQKQCCLANSMGTEVATWRASVHSCQYPDHPDTTSWPISRLQVACLIISTAEHCQEMVRQLARALAAKLEPRELAAK